MGHQTWGSHLALWIRRSDPARQNQQNFCRYGYLLTVLKILAPSFGGIETNSNKNNIFNHSKDITQCYTSQVKDQMGFPIDVIIELGKVTLCYTKILECYGFRLLFWQGSLEKLQAHGFHDIFGEIL